MLTDEQFRQTCRSGMEDVTGNEGDSDEQVIDIWEYVAGIPTADWSGHEAYNDCVEKVYRNEEYDHVLVMTRSANVYMCIVVDRQARSVFGHRLLDLNAEYGQQ